MTTLEKHPADIYFSLRKARKTRALTPVEIDELIVAAHELVMGPAREVRKKKEWEAKWGTAKEQAAHWAEFSAKYISDETRAT
jgi:hypothetical protein